MRLLTAIALLIGCSLRLAAQVATVEESVTEIVCDNDRHYTATYREVITIHNENAVKGTPYHYMEEVNIGAGDLMIEVKPLSPSQSTSNKDRFAVWNIMWEPM